jgi:glycosyltransferase involved in cell wall biosynthesis
VTLTILSVAYPLAPVSPDAAGGAEQVLSLLDRAIVAAGHRSIVVAQEGSCTAGTLVPVAAPAGELDDIAKAKVQAATRAAIASATARFTPDIIHLHGIDFPSYLPPPGPPVLATLHLPPSWYPAEALRPGRPKTWINCVSEAQHATCPASPALLPAIPNGIDTEALQARHAKRRYAMFLGRICPEKGTHLAIEAAKVADISLLIAGEVFAYEAHRRYFAEEVRPRLDSRRRFLGPIGFARKRRLLTAARCLLVPSLAPETSSLVAREALACGTPVIAFPNGALSDAVEHGRTGFLVSDAGEMAQAIGRADRIDPEACRETARRRFGKDQMVAAYLDLYARLAAQADSVRLHGAA